MKTDLKLGLGVFAAYCVYVFWRSNKEKQKEKQNPIIFDFNSADVKIQPTLPEIDKRRKL